MNDLAIYKAQSFGHQAGFGRRPALVIVDFTVGFSDPRTFGGGNINAAIEQTVELLAYCRGDRLPVAFSRLVYAPDGSDAGVFTLKVPALATLTETNPAGQIVPQLSPRPGEYIVRKTQPSAFFATGLGAWLIGRGVDTLIVAGCTTSGCVRATVVDAVSSNFRTIVATDCVGDRAIAPHEANLFDMGQKYADLMARDEVIARLRELPSSER